MKEYKGSRDPRFVAIHRGGTLTPEIHRLLALWAAKCAEHVLPLFVNKHPKDNRPHQAIKAARSWARGEITMLKAREAAYAAHAAARETKDLAAKNAARAAGHAAATAHMADHELGAAAYAIKAVQAANPRQNAISAGEAERAWQRNQLTEEIRELVLSDQKLRNKKMWSLFE